MFYPEHRHFCSAGQSRLFRRLFRLDRRVRNLRKRILGLQERLASPLGEQFSEVAGLVGLRGNGLNDEPEVIPPDQYAISWKLQLGGDADGLTAAVAEERGFARVVLGGRAMHGRSHLQSRASYRKRQALGDLAVGSAGKS